MQMQTRVELTSYFQKREEMLINPALLPSVQDTIPLPVYAPSDVLVLTDRRRNIRRLHAVCRAFKDRGVTELRHSIEMLALPSPGRTVATVRFLHVGSGMAQGEFSRVNYYLHQQSEGIRVAMLEVLQCPAYSLAEERQFQLRA